MNQLRDDESDGTCAANGDSELSDQQTPRPKSHGYMTSLHLAGRDVLVAGGGRVATRRVPVLLGAGARVRIVSPTVTAELSGLIRDHGSEHSNDHGVVYESRKVREDDVDGAWYVLAATNDPQVNAMLADAAQVRHTFCVRADSYAQGSASTPATGSAGGFTVGVVGPRDPRVTARVRDELVQVLKQRITADTPSRSEPQ